MKLQLSFVILINSKTNKIIMHWLIFEKYETTCEWQVFPCLEKIAQENAEKS